MAETNQKTVFWKNFTRLCNIKDVKPNNVTKAIGLSNATATDWKNGSIPRDTTLKKIADYFCVPVSALTSDADEPLRSPAPSADDITSGLTPDEVEELKKYAAFLISKRDKK